MNRRLRHVHAAALLLALAPAASPQALEPDRDQPFSINAQHIELDQKTGNIVYRGNVTIVQGSLRILADSLEARRQQGRPELLIGRGSPLRVSARVEGRDGDVELRAGRLEFSRSAQRLRLEDRIELVHGEFRLEAGQLEYRRAQAQIDLSGGVVVHRDEDVFRAPFVHIDLNEDRLSAGSPPGADRRERVTAVLQPRKDRP
jgi:lipopolysaccharide export system protein LptA